MKVHVEVPNYFWLEGKKEHQDFRAFYGNLISALLAEGCDVAVSRFEANVEAEQELDTAGGLSFAYHTHKTRPGVYCVKGSAISGLWLIDRLGYSGWSEIASDKKLQQNGLTFPIDRASRTISTLRARFLAENFSKYPQKSSPLNAEILSLAPFVFYPLQISADEVLKLSRFAQVDVIRQLVKLAEDCQIHIVMKRHPYCISSHIGDALQTAAKSQFVTVLDDSIHRIIPLSSAVIVGNSGVGLEALIHGKPVYSFAESEYAHMTTDVHTIADFSLAFGPQPSIQPDSIQRQLGYLLCDYFLDGDDASAISKKVKNILADVAPSGNVNVNFDSLTERRAKKSSIFAIDKMLQDSVDYMLAVYDLMPAETKQRMSQLLAREAVRSSEPDQMVMRFDEKTLTKYNQLCFKEKKLELAEKYSRLMLEKYPSSSARYMLAKILFAKGDKINGMLLAEEAAHADDAPPEALVFIGHKRFATKPDQAPLALEFARKAQAIQPDYARAYWLEALVLSHLEHHSGALRAATQAVELASTNPLFRSLLDNLQSKQLAGN